MPNKYDKVDGQVLLVPESYRDMFVRPIVVALVTVMPDGQPQATPIWVDYDGTYVRVNSARDDTSRWLEVRGRIAEVTQVGANEHINALNLKYEGHADFFANKQDSLDKEQRVTYKIEPLRINTNSD
jgi:hypothetical protein